MLEINRHMHGDDRRRLTHHCGLIIIELELYAHPSFQKKPTVMHKMLMEVKMNNGNEQ